MKRILFIISLSFLCCCNQIDQNLSIDLSKRVNNGEIAFNEFYNNLLISTLMNRYPSYYEEQLLSYNIDKNDSVVLSTLNTDLGRFKYSLFKNGHFHDSLFNQLRIDSLKEKIKPDQKQLNVGIFFDKNHQVVMTDANSDRIFSDNEKMTFDKDFSWNPIDKKKISKLPIYDFQYWNALDDSIYFYNRKIVVYPNSTNPKFPVTQDQNEQKSRLIVEFKDYWYGNFEYMNNNYDVAIQGANNKYSDILIKHDSLNFDSNDQVFNDNFSYSIGDTIRIAQDYFQLDALNYEMNQLDLKKINGKGKLFYSNKIGYSIKNFELIDLNLKKFELYPLMAEGSKYTLLYFWGTWCKPCIDKVSEIKSFYQDYGENVNIIGIALDNDINIVKNYVLENNLSWFQSFVDRRNRENSIIEGLNINNYPTYILLDNNKNTIVSKGVGDTGFQRIKNLID
jgi:thiol-disulfide isomerase/thioredoxin